MKSAVLVAMLLVWLGAGPVWADDPLAPVAPGESGASMAPPPGSTRGLHPQGGTSGVIGGHPGTSRPRIQPSRPGVHVPPNISPSRPRPESGMGVGQWSLDVPSGPEEEGPADGMTLDQAIDRLHHGSLTLQAKRLEIPQARADELTASLRSNPFLYGGAQLVPYRRYGPQNPGGPTQYDLNVTYPLDITGKRVARIEVANQARRTIEAQFQDAVRNEMDYLYAAYVDTLAARETLRFSRASLEAINRALEVQGSSEGKTEDEQLQRDHVEIHRNSVELGIMEAEANLLSAKRNLGMMLNLPPEYADQLQLRGTLRDSAAEPPKLEELIPWALAARPDLAAYRLGVCRASADVRLARANRLSDVYVLYQPYTYQDNSPYGFSGSRSWALGATVPLPIYDRNQGNIRKAQVNVDQTKLELAAQERRVIDDVEDAYQEYQVSRAIVQRIEQHLLPAARHVRDHSLKLSQQAGGDIYAYLIAQRDYQDLVRQYRDALVRHRRSMLHLNTVVGNRILP